MKNMSSLAAQSPNPLSSKIVSSIGGGHMSVPNNMRTMNEKG